MNDFLQHLRNGNDKRYNKGRKPYNGNAYAGTEHQRDWSRNGQAEPGQEKIASIDRLLEMIAETQTRLADIENRRADAEERKAQAMEQSLRFINEIAERLLSRRQDNGAALLHTLAAVINGETTPLFRKSDDEYRQHVLQVIAKMRGNRATYDEIASYLEREHMPTFSGRGNWHAQTIHRICRQLAC